MPTDDASLDTELRALVAAGHKIDAIKRYRELTGAGLKEAKDAVEALERGEAMHSRDQGDVPFETEIVVLLKHGRKIDAIKLYREKTGAGLKEAKDFIEALAADHRIIAAPRSGCLGVALLVMVLLVAAVVIAGERNRRPDAVKGDGPACGGRLVDPNPFKHPAIILAKVRANLEPSLLAAGFRFDGRNKPSSNRLPLPH